MDKIAIPGAIVVAGLLIAGAVIFGGNGATNPENNNQPEGDPTVILPITENDNILGSPNAKITIVEYSDIDCPFCKSFHDTMKQIIEEYGPTGEVAWVYRHFPLTVIHPNAARHAEAAECVADLGGNQAFWNFLDVLFENAPGNQQTDPSRYAEFAAQVGVAEADLQACIDSGDKRASIETQFNQALDAGATGTPFNLIVVEGQDPVVLPGGAVPYDRLKATIDQILASQE